MDNQKQTIFDIVKFALLTLIIVIPIRTYIAQPFIVSGLSMFPTYEDGEYLIIDELSYYLRSPERGEVVVFRYPNDPSKFFIKRLIGKPGETITLSGNKVTIKDAGGTTSTLTEDYINKDIFYDYQKIILDDGEYFVMGDNRQFSLDSRSWGAVDEDLIKGRVLVRLLPLSRIALLPGDNRN